MLNTTIANQFLAFPILLVQLSVRGALIICALEEALRTYWDQSCVQKNNKYSRQFPRALRSRFLSLLKKNQQLILNCLNTKTEKSTSFVLLQHSIQIDTSLRPQKLTIRRKMTLTFLRPQKKLKSCLKNKQAF